MYELAEKCLTIVLDFRAILLLKEEIFLVHRRWGKGNLESIMKKHQKITCRTQFSYQKSGRKRDC